MLPAQPMTLPALPSIAKGPHFGAYVSAKVRQYGPIEERVSELNAATFALQAYAQMTPNGARSSNPNGYSAMIAPADLVNTGRQTTTIEVFKTDGPIEKRGHKFDLTLGTPTTGDTPQDLVSRTAVKEFLTAIRAQSTRNIAALTKLRPKSGLTSLIGLGSNQHHQEIFRLHQDEGFGDPKIHLEMLKRPLNPGILNDTIDGIDVSPFKLIPKGPMYEQLAASRQEPSASNPAQSPDPDNA